LPLELLPSNYFLVIHKWIMLWFTTVS